MPKTTPEMVAACEELADTKLTEIEVQAIKVGTMGQTENPNWFQQRKRGMTASIFEGKSQNQRIYKIITKLTAQTL